MNDPPDSTLPQDGQEVLLRVVQVYLKRRLEAVAPGALLTMFWEEFYRIYAPIVAGMVRRQVPESSDADDLIQEVWMTVARKLPDFQWNENRGGLRAWLGTLIRDKTVDLLRRRSEHRTVPIAEIRGGADQPSDRDADPALALEEQWRADAVKTVLEDLRPHIGEVNSRIIRLHYWEERTLPEIAGLVGLTASQVSSRLHRAFQRLRLRLAAYFGDSSDAM